jgi:hypothetical protein
MKKYGLQIRAPSQKKQSSSRPPLRPASIFDEEEDHDVEKEISRQATKTKAHKEVSFFPPLTRVLVSYISFNLICLISDCVF